MYLSVLYFRKEIHLMDEINSRILALLQEDARTSYAELGREVGLTAPAIAERVRRLETDGIITGYHAGIDLEKAGRGMVAFVRLTSPHELGRQLSDLVREIPEVLEFHHVTGSEGFIMKLAVASVSHLERVIVQLLPYGQTNTSIVLSSPVTWRRIDFPAGE
jgi:Lrp/AsnC family transcriptional regulator, leucine-responsive regulatory protein